MKKLILLLLFIPLVFSCSSSDELQGRAAIVLTRLQTKSLKNLDILDKNCCDCNFAKGFTERFETNPESFYTNVFSGRDMTGEVLLKKGWDWKRKIYYDFYNDEGNIRFNNQEYINGIDRILFMYEYYYLRCYFYTGIRRENKDFYEKKYNQWVNKFLSFCNLNRNYFDSELIDEITEMIKNLPKGYGKIDDLYLD